MLEKPYAIVMNGHTASLKTYTARRIANVQKIGLIETNRLGRCTGEGGILDDKLRDKRYDIARDLTDVMVRNNTSLVIDGTFNFKKWRDEIYDPLLKNNFEIIIVRCFCDDADIVRARIEDRQSDKIRPEYEAAKMENYFRTRQEGEPIYEDKLPDGKISIVEFDTGKYTMKIIKNPTDISKIVRGIIWKDFHTGRLNAH
jgi:predicted kinase